MGGEALAALLAGGDPGAYLDDDSDLPPLPAARFLQARGDCPPGGPGPGPGGEASGGGREGRGARRVEGSPSPSPSPEVEVLELSSSFSSEWTPAAGGDGDEGGPASAGGVLCLSSDEEEHAGRRGPPAEEGTKAGPPRRRASRGGAPAAAARIAEHRAQVLTDAGDGVGVEGFEWVGAGRRSPMELDGGGGGSRAGPAPPPSPPESFPWLVRLPHFRPVEVLKRQAFDPEAPPVHVDYRRQFQSQAARVAHPRGFSSGAKQSGWRETKEGEKFFVNSSGKQVRMGKARTGEGLKGSLNRGAGARGKRKGGKRKARKRGPPRRKPRAR